MDVINPTYIHIQFYGPKLVMHAIPHVSSLQAHALDMHPEKILQYDYELHKL
jgi:hypothetical protein